MSRDVTSYVSTESTIIHSIPFNFYSLQLMDFPATLQVVNQLPAASDTVHQLSFLNVIGRLVLIEV